MAFILKVPAVNKLVILCLSVLINQLFKVPSSNIFSADQPLAGTEVVLGSLAPHPEEPRELVGAVGPRDDHTALRTLKRLYDWSLD